MPCSLAAVVDIFRVGSCRSRIRAPTSGIRASGTTKRLAEAAVEALGGVAHQLDVLALVLPHRHLVGAVGEHVGGHQDGVEEQPGGHELALGERLVAELVHALELADRRHRRQQPRQLGVLLDVGLAEQHAALGVQAGGDQERLEVVPALAQLGRVVVDGDRVEVDDAVDRRVAALLAGDVLRDAADVVAQVLAPGRLDAGEDPHEPAKIAARPEGERGGPQLGRCATRCGAPARAARSGPA